MDHLLFMTMYVIVAFCFILGFAYMLKKRSTLTPEEKLLAGNTNPGKSGNVIYTENCGARFDSMNYTIPFVRVTLYSEFMIIKAMKAINLRYDEITGIELKNVFISKGVLIRHMRPDIPSKIIIWSFNVDRLYRVMQDALSKHTT